MKLLFASMILDGTGDFSSPLATISQTSVVAVFENYPEVIQA